ncbi:MAG TPA: response regulator [Microvirga sp.]|nr:response regulator [Microvirga sp.]
MNDVRSIPIVVAEDEFLVREVLTEHLHDAGYEVLEAENSDEALKLIQVHAGVRALITDVQMPGGTLDGIELAFFVHERWPSVHIIVCSGRVRPRANELPPGVEFLAKPFSGNRLLTTVHTLLERPDPRSL